MKKYLLILFFFCIGVYLINMYVNNKNNENTNKNTFISDKKEEDVLAFIDKYYVYGRYLNIEGHINKTFLASSKIKDVNILFHGLTNYSYDVEYTLNDNLNYKTSDIINDGIFLDDIKQGNYYIYLEVITNTNSYYYNLCNKTNYNDLEYYSLTTNDYTNKLNFSMNDISTLNVVDIKKPDYVYDIMIDAGHGGNDLGGLSIGQLEKDINLEYSLELKTKLEKLGLKVALTRHNDNFIDDLFPTYGDNSRISKIYESFAKYNLSIHANSYIYNETANGFELYTAPNINYNFSKDIVNNIIAKTGINYSTNGSNYKVDNGLYTKVMTDVDKKNISESALEKNYEPYYVNENTPYYYIIRETGGIVTGAYIDGRDKDFPANKYYNSNRGVESYLVELGYMTNYNDMEIIKNKKNEYIEAIVLSVEKEIKK